MATRYGLVGKLLNKGEIAGYFIVDSSGKQMLITKEKFFKLTSQGLVQNWEVINDSDGEKHLYSRDLSLTEIPTMIKDESYAIEIKTRIIKDEAEIGFLCIDNSGDKRNLTTNKLWDLARLGRIKNVTAYKSDDSRVLISKDNFLRGIQEITL